jgi:hypothetical protein
MSTPTTSRLKSSAIEKSKLELLGIRTINILVPSKEGSRLLHISTVRWLQGEPNWRNMRPTFHHLLELARSANFELEYSGNWQERPSLRWIRKSRDLCVVHLQVVFVRGISQYWSCYEYWCPAALQQGLDELERAQGNSKSLTVFFPNFPSRPSRIRHHSAGTGDSRLSWVQ